jgi:predicted nucleotidyltransferase
MTREHLIAKLRAHEAALQRGGIVHLRLFGSMARGEASAASDVDLIADFDGSRKLTLFDKAGLEVELAELLDTHVDLSDRAMLRDTVRKRAEQEAILVF